MARSPKENPFNFEGAAAEPATPSARRSAAPGAPAGRHALGMPAGSVRALLAFLILGLIWTLMYLQKEIPLYLQYLMFMVLGHYFAAHNQSIRPAEERERSPLFLPRGVIRVLIFLGFVGVLGVLYHQHRDDLGQILDDLKANDARNKYLPLLLVMGFFLGLIASKLGGFIGSQSGSPGWYQDIQAWLSLLAMLALGAEVIIELVVNPSLQKDGKEIMQLPQMENILAAVVGFYFGARS